MQRQHRIVDAGPGGQGKRAVGLEQEVCFCLLFLGLCPFLAVCKPVALRAGASSLLGLVQSCWTGRVGVGTNLLV